MNRGDANYLTLNIKVNSVDIGQHYADEIELTFNKENGLHTIKKTLSDGGITWNATRNKFMAYLSQEDTFNLEDGANTWQIRLLKDDVVISNTISIINIGDANSKEVLEDD